ncbi:MAG: tyrosine recombinase XerD [Actinobacteria bacterium]|nr:tyrosine recombinase XerD [Actinomycetota bacterium]
MSPGADGTAGASPLVVAGREFLNYIQVERGASVNTVLAYRRAVVRYLDYLLSIGIEAPDDITREALVGFAGELSSRQGAGLSPRSVAQVFSAVRMFHRFMVTEGYAESDQSTVLASPRTPHRLPRALDRDQVEKLLDAPAGGDPRGVRDRLILEMLYATGMRISELVGLDVVDLDLPERIVTCRGKGGKWRLLPFGRETHRLALLYLDEARPLLAGERHSAALILNARGGRLTRQGCWKIIKGHAAAVGMEDRVTPHVLRHTFATHMLEGGANLLVVQELLGHSSISTTQIYTEVTGKHLMEVYRNAHPRA